uniref:Uncharacterized protein n=1 Tax=Tanacetum cinerariifolium TaxID=118510 RepID=A0A699GK05_TANCI|nr:hypothetical protein [Tanacetum cinerariifolium]
MLHKHYTYALIDVKKDQLGAKHQLAVKGLSECKASESNIRRIQVKDIVKEVEDYLKTYSSAGMDITYIRLGLSIGIRAVLSQQTQDICIVVCRKDIHRYEKIGTLHLQEQASMGKVDTSLLELTGQEKVPCPYSSNPIDG